MLHDGGSCVCMSHGTHMNESWRNCELSHGKHINES